MSDMEHWTGVLTELKLPEDVKTFGEAIKYFNEEGFHISDFDKDEEWIYPENSDIVYINEKWYKFEAEKSDYEQSMIVKKGKKHYFCTSFYNGGTCLSEMLEEMLSDE